MKEFKIFLGTKEKHEIVTSSLSPRKYVHAYESVIVQASDEQEAIKSAIGMMSDTKMYGKREWEFIRIDEVKEIASIQTSLF